MRTVELFLGFLGAIGVVGALNVSGAEGRNVEVPIVDGVQRVISTTPSNAVELDRRVGWLDPRIAGGSMIDFTTPRRGEPLNLILSGLSDSRILSDEGFKAYITAIGFAPECLGIHVGNLHRADLGDGNGAQIENFLGRQSYFNNPVYGSCIESLAGGHHFRGWKQAGTGAWFLGVSKELYIGKHHVIAPDGYNLGRNWFVERALQGGKTGAVQWTAKVEWNEDLLEPGRKGINHGIKQDGRVAVVTVMEVPH